MRLLKLNEVFPDGSGRVYRQGRLQAGLCALALTVMLLIFPTFLVAAGGSWLLALFFLAPAIFLVPLLVSNFLATLRSANWVLWIRDEEVLINCRSYQDTSDLDHGCVVAISYGEIASVRKYAERYTTPRPRGGSIYYSLQALDLELLPGDGSPLEQALRASRLRPQPQKRFLGIGIRSRPAHFAVKRIEPSCLRIYWRGGIGHWLAPSLAQALSDLAAHTGVGEPTQRDRGDWRDLEGAALDEHILGLVESGAKFDAIRLLEKRRGYTSSEARQFVEQLAHSETLA